MPADPVDCFELIFLLANFPLCLTRFFDLGTFLEISTCLAGAFCCYCIINSYRWWLFIAKEGAGMNWLWFLTWLP